MWPCWGHAWLLLFTFGFNIYSEPAGAIFAACVVAGLFLWADSWGLRDRIFQKKSSYALLGWTTLAVLAFISLVKIPAPPQPQGLSASSSVQSASPAAAGALTHVPSTSPATALSANGASPTAAKNNAAAATPDATKAARDEAIIEHLGAANSFVAAKNWDAALKEYQAILALDPSNADANAGQRTVQATATASAQVAATATASKAIVDHLGAANSFVQASNWLAAIKEYNAILAIDPNQPDAKSAKDNIVNGAKTYANTIVPLSQQYGDAEQSMSSQMQMAESVPMLLVDAGWRRDTFAVITVLESTGDELAAVPARPIMGNIQRRMVTLRDETHGMAQDLRLGLNNLDPQAIAAATVHVQTITDTVNQATVELGQIQEQL